MAKKNTRNTRASIVDAAWQLFYEQGYEDTTVEDMIVVFHTSKGSFYHYFGGKDALLATLSDLFDQKYQDLQPTLDPADAPALQPLPQPGPVSNDRGPGAPGPAGPAAFHPAGDHRSAPPAGPSANLLPPAALQIIAQGQETGQLTRDQSVSDMVKIYALCERALLYDWCLCGGEYSLAAYALVADAPVPGTASLGKFVWLTSTQKSLYFPNLFQVL